MVEVELMYSGIAGAPERLSYGVIAIQLTNNIRKISRVYPLILDAMQNIGGSAEVLVFLFVFFMVIHHSVIMDLYMLNEAVLMDQSGQTEASKRRN